MSEPIAKHQMFEYEINNPFQIINLEGPLICEENLLNHWHTELEMAYIFQGQSDHYVDGNCIHAAPGDLVVVNSESIHSIIPDHTACQSRGMIAVVLIISRDFVMNINQQKNNERLKGIIQHVERHYMEPITQSDTAKRFYFTNSIFPFF